MTTVPTYRLTCHSPGQAQTLAGILRKRGFPLTDNDGDTLSVRYGGGFNAIAEIGDLARHLDIAGDIEVSEFYMQWDRERSAR